eukprot:6527230-Prorocentrum_lima.AAC.1
MPLLVVVVGVVVVAALVLGLPQVVGLAVVLQVVVFHLLEYVGLLELVHAQFRGTPLVLLQPQRRGHSRGVEER